MEKHDKIPYNVRVNANEYYPPLLVLLSSYEIIIKLAHTRHLRQTKQYIYSLDPGSKLCNTSTSRYHTPRTRVHTYANIYTHTYAHTHTHTRTHICTPRIHEHAHTVMHQHHQTMTKNKQQENITRSLVVEQYDNITH